MHIVHDQLPCQQGVRKTHRRYVLELSCRVILCRVKEQRETEPLPCRKPRSLFHTVLKNEKTDRVGKSHFFTIQCRFLAGIFIRIRNGKRYAMGLKGTENGMGVQ